MTSQENAKIEKLLRHQACPMTASVNWDPKQDSDSDVEKWLKVFYGLSFSLRLGLLSNKAIDAILKFADEMEIKSIEKVGEVSRIVREIFTKKIGKDEIKERLLKKIKIEESKLDVSISRIKKITELVKEVGESEVLETTERLPIIPALKKYEKLGGQEITEGEIQLEISGNKEFVEPTIRNWLEDYIQNKGAQAHNNLERSDYLYKSQNTEILSTQERDRLSLVLRSYDLDENVFISKSDQEILFENVPRENESRQILTERGNKIDLSQQKKEGGEEKNIEGISQNIQQKKDESKGRQQESFERMMSEDNIDDERSRNKPNEITWYGKSAPFDNLEQINTNSFKQGSQEKLENRTSVTAKKENEKRVDFASNDNPQKTKHIVDLKRNS